jgi:hypothetical protein
MSPLDDSTPLHPKLRRLFGYWRTIHPVDRLPGRRQFDPAANPDLLPNLKLVDVHREPLRLRYRLLGTAIDAALGRSVVDQWLDEVHGTHPNWPTLLADYRAVIDSRAPCWRRGAPRVVADIDCAIVETLRLPLARDGQRVDMVLGLTLCFDAAGNELRRSRLARQ